jgi:hypothetical protein
LIIETPYRSIPRVSYDGSMEESTPSSTPHPLEFGGTIRGAAPRAGKKSSLEQRVMSGVGRGGFGAALPAGRAQ